MREWVYGMRWRVCYSGRLVIVIVIVRITVNIKITEK